MDMPREANWQFSHLLWTIELNTNICQQIPVMLWNNEEQMSDQVNMFVYYNTRCRAMPSVSLHYSDCDDFQQAIGVQSNKNKDPNLCQALDD